MTTYHLEVRLTVSSDDEDMDEEAVMMAVSGVLYSERTWEGSELTYSHATIDDCVED